ncbi:hypothetical protein N806_09975 [Rhodococcus sp. P27]|uniref:DUF262 domain-containing protein n=1 Tax=Rhodococcus sp. MS13 TaxID=2579940 RepID=UPI00038FD512|nr:DUF262 domain-containing protein [Rhodococcus sp. MS13]ERB51519.1 hypothetical protein N806_09975 [Rhodococcus sp. P27]NRH33915.1 DUF262 domain-containing protein [Rhodococcus sp. MS13]
MQIDAHKRTLGQVLQQGQHIVPRYQRRYAWESQNIKDFWSDITDTTEPHFLGSMVTSGATSAPREVIDGQQRLTTTIITLCVLRDLYQEFGNTARVTGIKEYLEYIDRDGHRNHRLKNRDASAAGRLNDNILLDREHRAVAPGYDPGALESQAYDTFERLARDLLQNAPDKIQQLDEIRDAILESEVVYINVEDRKNAFTIFETLNDRGKSLTVLDLVKNLLFAEIASSDEDSSERAWSQILEMLDDLTFEGMTPDVFLYYAWNSKHHARNSSADTVEQARLRRSIADQIESSNDRDAAARDLIIGLQTDAKILAGLNQTLSSNGSPDPWRGLDTTWRRDKYEDICDRLYGVLVAGSSQPFPLLLSLMRAYLSEHNAIPRKTLIEFLDAVESFQFRWSIAQKSSTSTIRRIYRQSASLVSASTSKPDFESAIKSFVTGASKIDASDAQFRDGISRLAYSRTRSKDSFKIRHILTRIEKSYQETKLDLSRQLSMEHLQGLEGRSEVTPRNSWIFKIGNLALVPPEINSNLPKTFPDKCDELRNWINGEDKQLVEAIDSKVWKSEQANERHGAIIHRALELWPRTQI